MEMNKQNDGCGIKRKEREADSINEGVKNKSSGDKQQDHINRKEDLQNSSNQTTNMMKNVSPILPPDLFGGINGTRSQLYGNALANDSLIDERMQKIVNELVANVGISESGDVGKAAELFYTNPVKAKVLFALPSEMRKSYVNGFLYPTTNESAN